MKKRLHAPITYAWALALVMVMAIATVGVRADDEGGDTGTKKAQEEKPELELELELVTFNIRYLNRKEEGKSHWRHRKELVSAAMLEFKADIFGLQEALRPQLDHIAATVPGFTEFGIGRDDGKKRGEYSPILFRTDRFELDENDSGTFWLSDTPEKVASMTWGNEIPRICTWARLTDKKSGRSLYVFNTHWDHRSQPSRERAAELISARIAKRKHADEPVVLMGDFNARPDNPAIKHLVAKFPDTYNAIDAAKRPADDQTATFHGFKGGRKGRKIDHVLTTPGVVVKSAEILYFNRDGAYPSDHYPVRAKVVFPD